MLNDSEVYKKKNGQIDKLKIDFKNQNFCKKSFNSNADSNSQKFIDTFNSQF